MKKKILLQIFLLLLIILISITFFKVYFKNENPKVGKTKIENMPENSNNLMSNIKYVATDKKGNKFNIKSKNAEIDPNQPELILMKNVEGVIMLINSTPIVITSDNAIYNKINHNTVFYSNVTVDYDEHLITSNNLDLFFEENFAAITNNIIYKNLSTELYADKIEIDLITKNSKIFMNDKTKKVKVVTLN